MKRSADWIFICVCGLIAGGLTYGILRNGILASPDSWSYWEGSISLLEHGRYSRFLGDPIPEWPPLFPAYLALAQKVGAQTGLWLMLAMSLLGLFNVLAWGFYIARLFRGQRDLLARIAFGGSVAFTALFVPLCSLMLLAQFMMLAFVGLAFGAMLLTLAAETAKAFVLRSVLVAATLCLALLSHNSALVYVAPATLVLLLHRGQPIRIRHFSAAMIIALSVFPWYGIRWLCGQLESHPPGSPQHSPLALAGQSLLSLGDLFLSSSPRLWPVRAALGLALLLFLGGALLFRKKLNLPALSVSALVLAGFSFLLLFVLFNVTWIDSGLSGRFLWYVPLALLPVLLQVTQRRMLVLLCILVPLLGVSAARNLKWVARSVVAPLPPSATVATDMHIRPWYYLTEIHPEQRPEGTTQVVPPTYSWMPRWEKSELPGEERTQVWLVRKVLEK